MEQRNLMESLNMSENEVMKWNRMDDLTLNTYSDKYSCNSHCPAKIPRDEESESIMRDISAYLQCSLRSTNTVCYSLGGSCQPNVHIYLYPCSAAVSCAEGTWQVFRFRWAFFFFFLNKAQEEGEFRNQLWL